MFTLRGLVAVLAVVSLGACSSGSDAVQSVFDGVPAGDNQAASTDAVVEAVPSDVPAVQDAYVYYGKKALVAGVRMDTNIPSFADNAIFDAEYNATEDQSLEFDQLGSLYVGSCEDEERTSTWMEVDGDGAVLKSEVVRVFDDVEVEAGKRYLLRVEYKKLTGCGVYTTINLVVE